MPPKPKLHKAKGKSESVFSKDAKLEQTSSQEANDNTELQEQFEVELCWCIQQLQRTLNSGKSNQRQVQEQTKVLNALMNNSTPFIKKRQLMRITFGDYRAKMVEENKKVSKGINMKISPSSPSKKSQFVKKSLFASHSDNNFKFNFAVENDENHLSDNMSKIEIKTEYTPPKPFHFTVSTNDFRFDFNTDEN